jgi:hypothetical protein
VSGVLVEVWTFEGCPHAQPALALAERVVAASGVEATVRRVDIADADAAVEYRFLGSPTIRVNGVDVEPGANERREYVLACRVYRTSSGGSKGEPEERWLRSALEAAR